MRWLRNISFSPSSTVKSPADSDDHNSGGVIWRFGASKHSRRKKLRNLSGRDPATTVSLPKWSDSAPSEAASLSRSPSASDHAVPLPLPETSPLFQRRESNSNSGSGDVDCPLPSPKVPHKIGAGAGAVTNAPIKSVFDCRERQKKEDHGETRSSTRANQDLRRYPEKSRNSFRIDVPSRSAPTSPFASPALSPPRNGSGNLSNFRYVAPVGNQGWSTPELPNSHYVPSVGNHGWSAPELPISAMMRGVPPAFFDGCALSSESSPMHSPTGISPHQDARSPTGPASPLHTKLSLETHAARRESSATVSVHPLPLPPGVPMHSSSTSMPLPSASMPSPSTSMPTPSTSMPLRSTSMPSPSTSMPLPSTSMPSPSTAMPLQSTPIPSPSTPITQANTKTESMSMKDQWQKGKLIGRGTFGSVYVASNRENGALCAMKEVELFPDDPKSDECIKQLEQEIKVLSQLKHPNIVQYYGSDIVEDRLYIYLEYVHPGSINKYVREHCGAMTESVVRNFTRHILSGLAYLHSTKTIHRDIKGANLLVDSCGVVKLADFGMAKHLTGQVADLSLKGSPYWMAPELLLSVMQKDNSSDLALAVDIWSLGCTIIEMFTGKPPWSKYEGAAAMFKVMRDTPSIPESLSFEGRDFLKCCFQRNPAERPTAAMLLEHPFVKNLQHPDAPSCSQAVGANLLDKCYSPSEQYSSKFDQFPMFPSPQNSKGKMAAESVIGQLSHHETSDLTVKSRYSPRSTLEALPISSPPHSVQNLHHLGSPANMPNMANHSNKNHTLL